MKTVTVSRFTKRAVWLLSAALIFTQQAAQACPGCKQNMVMGADGKAPPLNGDSLGFGLSIFFMLFMIAALLGGLGFMMYRSCQTIAARQQVMLDEEEVQALGGFAAQPQPA